MKLDWQHVALGIVVLGCATACIVLGHGALVIQILAGVGGASGVAALVKGSPLGDKDEEKKP